MNSAALCWNVFSFLLQDQVSRCSSTGWELWVRLVDCGHQVVHLFVRWRCSCRGYDFVSLLRMLVQWYSILMLEIQFLKSIVSRGLWFASMFYHSSFAEWDVMYTKGNSGPLYRLWMEHQGKQCSSRPCVCGWNTEENRWSIDRVLMECNLIQTDNVLSYYTFYSS